MNCINCISQFGLLASLLHINYSKNTTNTNIYKGCADPLMGRTMVDRYSHYDYHNNDFRGTVLICTT